MIDWLKSALATVYSKDGLIGVAAIVVLLLVVVVVIWYLGIDVTGFFKL